MDNIRVAVLSTCDQVCTVMDNGMPKALHFYSDELHSYLDGAANTFSFTASARHEDSKYLVKGNKLSFRYRNKDYYFNIMKERRTEYTVEIEAYSLMFELLNDKLGEYKASRAMTFAEYLEAFDTDEVVELNLNEVSDKAITNEWTGTSTILARIFSLANVFDAEAELVPELNKDYSLKRLVLNVYKANDGECQGIGRKRTDITLRYGVNVKGITKTAEILDLRTAIRPTGNDGLTIAALDKTEYDADGKVEFRSPAGDPCIYAVQARDRFPSNTLENCNGRYIMSTWSYDTDNANTLYGQSLAQLRKICEPKVTYEVDGYFDTDIGDTVNIADEEYIPPLYLEARVTEQVRSFTDPARNKTTFDNFVELNSEISEDLLKRMEALIAENKVYACMISTDNGIVFKNSTGSTTLTANVRDAGADVTDDFTIQWKKDGVGLAAGKTIIVNASDVDVKSVYRFEAVDAQEKIRGNYEVTVTDVSDGKDGKDGINGLSAYEVAVKNGFAGSVEEWLLSLIGKDGKDGIPGDPGKDGKTPYLHIAYANSADGKTGFDVSDATNKTYIGQYTDFTQADSTDPAKYTWARFQGDKGEKGTQGINILLGTKYMGDYPRSSNVTMEDAGNGLRIATWNASGTLAWNVINTLPIAFSLIRGKKVTLSLYVRSDDYESLNADPHGLVLGFSLCTATSANRTLYKAKTYYTTALSDEWMQIVWTATLADSFFTSGSGTIDDTTRLYIQVYNYSIYSMQAKMLKLETGDVPDPVWTPAIEDLEGVGISDITNKYAVSSSNTMPPATWSESVPTMTTANKYLWNYEIIAYTDGTTSETAKRVIGVYGDTGGAGKGIKSITEYYLASANSSGVTTTTSGWTTSIQTTTGTKKYLWNYEVVTFTDNTTHTSTPVIIGTHGTDGQDGERGTGILKITTAPAAYTTATNGITPAYRIALSTVLSQTGVAEVLTGDILEYSYYPYPVLMVYSSYVYCGARTNIRGAAGTAGANGTNGKDGENGKMLYGTCATAAGTAAKTVACAEAKSLYAGLTVLAEFSAANTASAPTLNVNSLGAKQIYINGAVTGSSNLFLWGAGAKIQFTYNGTYWIPVGHPCAYYGTSSTAAATAAKTSAIAGIVVCKGTTVGIKFTYANSAVSPTLNLSSVGAKAVCTQGVACAYWQAGATVSFTFDGTYWRVSSEPVYASEVVVGNAAAKNVHIDSEGVDIRNGNTDVASFGEDLIELGKNSDAAAIEMCKGVCEIALNDDCLNILLKKTYTKMLIGIMNQAAGAPDPFIEFCGGEASSNMCFSSGLSGSIYLHEIARMVKNTPVFIQGTKVVTGTGTNYVTMLTNAQVLSELQKREITPADGWENYVTIIAINGDGVANGTPLTGVEYWGGSYNSWYAYFAASISGAYRINYTIIYDQNHGKAVL